MAWRELSDYLSKKIEAFRRRVDVDEEGREQQFVVEAARTLEQSRAEKSLQRIAQTIDAVLADEIIRTPSGKAYVPERFVVFFNPADEREWQGNKREFIRGELAEIIMNEARRRAGEHDLITEQISIDFRIDATLDDDELRVSAVYNNQRELTVFANDQQTFVTGLGKSPQTRRWEDRNEKTEVNATAEPFYAIDVWENGKHSVTIPIYKRAATIGRGTSSFPVDVPLRGAAVSRRHAVLEIDENKQFWLTHIGANPTVLENQELPLNARTALSPEHKIEICGFKLQITNLSK